MPPHDFRKQIDGQDFSFDLIEYCTNRYQVSLTSALLKLIEFNHKRAMLVVSRDGYILWTRSSKSAFKTGIFIKTNDCSPIELPSKSIAYKQINIVDNKVDYQHIEGVWWPTESVREMTVFSDKFDLVITLLLFPDYIQNCSVQQDEEPELINTYDKLYTN